MWLEADLMGTSQWIVYGSSDRAANTPFVPDVGSTDAPPKISFEQVTL